MSDVVPFWKYFLSGTTGGAALTLVGHPLDTIKVRIQTQEAGKRMFNGTLDCFIKTVKNEGFFGLYKGVISPLFGMSAIFALVFCSYGFGKKVVARTDDASKMKITEIFLAGTFAGLFPAIVCVPMERIKVLLQVEYNQTGKRRYNGVFDCARKIGIRGMYQGTMSTLYRDIPGAGFYYGAYELFLRLFLKGEKKTRNDLNSLHFLFSGGMAGVSCWLYMIFPDTIKSRIQASEAGKYRNFYHATKDTISKEGMGIFFKGAMPVFLRSFPANAACFLVYEYTMRALNKITKKKER